MRHRIALFTDISLNEERSKALSSDATSDPDDLKEVSKQLDIDRAELANYSEQHAEEIVAEEIAIMEVHNQVARERDELQSQVESLEASQDELLDQIRQRDAWIKEHGTDEQQWNYAREFEPERNQGYSR